MNPNLKGNIEPATSHGQFYKADELVELIYQDFGGFHPDARTVRANGRIYAGEFIARPAAKLLSRAAHFQGERGSGYGVSAACRRRHIPSQ